jgi:hypothetical protein
MPLRQSKRIKSAGITPTKASGGTLGASKTTSKKSKHFQENKDGEIADDFSSILSSEDDDENASVVSSPVESESDENDAYSEESEAPRKTSAKKTRDPEASGKMSKVSDAKGKELWRPGVTTGLGPGKEVFIKLPKARDAGDTPYEDDTIHPNTFLFLKDLDKNNERQWLKGMTSVVY